MRRVERRSGLVIHDSEFLSRPTISCVDSYASGWAILLSPTLIDPDMQDPASELRRIPLPRTPVNKGKERKGQSF